VARAQRKKQKQKRAIETPAERVAFWVAWWAVCYVLWVLLVFKTELAELVVGAVMAAVAATAVELVRNRGYAPFAIRLRWARSLLGLPWRIAVDTWLLTHALWRQLARGEPIHGQFRTVHFPDCKRDDPESEARRAVAKWLGGVAPNSYVIGFDEERDLALVRQLVPTEEPPDIDPARLSS
jgi:hypothetical protein